MILKLQRGNDTVEIEVDSQAQWEALTPTRQRTEFEKALAHQQPTKELDYLDGIENSHGLEVAVGKAMANRESAPGNWGMRWLEKRGTAVVPLVAAWKPTDHEAARAAIEKASSPEAIEKSAKSTFDTLVSKRAEQLRVPTSTVHAKHLSEPAIAKAYSEWQMAKANAIAKAEFAQVEKYTKPAAQVDVSKKQAIVDELRSHVTKLALERGEPYGKTIGWAMANDPTTQKLYRQSQEVGQ